MSRIVKCGLSRLAAVVVACGLLASSGCAAMHKQQIANLRANGEHGRAACYEACGPSDPVCLKQCDNSHPPPVDPRLAQYAQIASAAVAADAAKAAPATTTPPAPADPRSTPTVGGSSTSSTSQRSLTINGQTYTGGDHLGQPCALDAPCPQGYKCHLVTSRSGQCVQ